jgi:hypothetical protein
MSDKFMKKLEELLEEQQELKELKNVRTLEDVRELSSEKALEYLGTKEWVDSLQTNPLKPEVVLAFLNKITSHKGYDGAGIRANKRYQEMLDDLQHGTSRNDWVRHIRTHLNRPQNQDGGGKVNTELRGVELVDSSVNKDNLEESFKNLQEAFSAFKVSLNEATAEEKQSYLKMLKELKVKTEKKVSLKEAANPIWHTLEFRRFKDALAKGDKKQAESVFINLYYNYLEQGPEDEKNMFMDYAKNHGINTDDILGDESRQEKARFNRMIKDFWPEEYEKEQEDRERLGYWKSIESPRRKPTVYERKS